MGMIMHTDGDFKLLCRESQEKLCSVVERESQEKKQKQVFSICKNDFFFTPYLQGNEHTLILDH